MSRPRRKMLIRMHVLISVYIQTELKWCLPSSAQYRISDSSSCALVWDFRSFDMHFCEPNQYTGILKFGPGFDSSNFVSHSIAKRKVSGYEVISTRRFKKRSVSLPWMLENIIWAHILYLMQYLDFLPKYD